MSTLNDTDLFVIERSGTLYQVRSDEVSTLQDTDLFVVEREGVQYKIESSDMNFGPTGSLQEPLQVLTPLNGAGIGPGTPYNPISSDIVTVASEPEVPVFSTTLYTGNDTSQSINTGLDNSSGKSMVWFKSRDAGTEHTIYDTERTPALEALIPHQTGSQSAADDLTAFTSTGVDIYNNTGWVNNTGFDYVAWNFHAAPGFFDIITWSGNGNSTMDIPHSLGAVPACAIVKSYNNSSFGWYVYHKDLGISQSLRLDNNSAADSGAYWSTMTDTTFGATQYVNHTQTGYNNVAYLFADNPDGGIKCGSYTDSNVFIETGFKPGWVLIRPINGGDWLLYDSKRGDGVRLSPNNSNAESSGFAYTSTDTGFTPANGQAGIYVAIAENLIAGGGLDLTCFDDTELDNMIGPVEMTDENGDLITPETSAITGVSGTAPNITLTFTDDTDLKYFQAGDTFGGVPFSTTLYTGNGGTQQVPTGVDNTGKSLIWVKNRDEATNHGLGGEHIGPELHLISNETFKPQGNSEGFQSFDADGYTVGAYGYFNSSSKNYVAWNFAAAPGFFDVVTYDGDGNTSQDIDHSLGTEPGLFIVKRTDSSGPWRTYHKSIGATQNLELDTSNAASPSSNVFNNTEPTSTQFTVGSNSTVNTLGGEYVAYLFADTPGKIKCGTYDGNASTQSIDCGFEAGWVLIKCFSETKNWFIWDKSRGDGVLLSPNDATADATYAGSIASSANGFTLGDLDGLNGSGKSFIYVAIAGGSTSEVVSVDVGTNSMVVDGGDFSNGDVISLPTLEASATDVTGLDGNTLSLSGASGNWRPNTRIKGATITSSAPSPDEVVFTTSNGGTTPVSGVDATLSARVWTLESGPSQTGPWTSVGQYEDLSANASQDGATPWEDHPDLLPNTYYQVKVKYNSDNAVSVESVFNTFKTGDAE